MPGFFINGSGGDQLSPSNTIETHRKHRWLIEKLGPIDSFETAALIAESVQLPEVDIEQHDIKAALLTYKYAKGVKWGDATITFYDTTQILSTIEKEWRDLVYTNAAGVLKHTPGSNGYKQDTTLQQLDGKGAIVRRLTLKNSWPRKIAHGPLSYGSSDIKLVTITLALDFVEREEIAQL